MAIQLFAAVAECLDMRTGADSPFCLHQFCLHGFCLLVSGKRMHWRTIAFFFFTDISTSSPLDMGCPWNTRGVNRSFSLMVKTFWGAHFEKKTLFHCFLFQYH